MPVVADVVGGGGIEIGGTADVAFVHGTGQVASDIVVEVDWDNDGDFDQPEENTTSFVLAAQTRAGRDFPSDVLGKARAGQFQATLRNDDDRFSFFNADSPLNTPPFSLRTGRKARIRTSGSTPDDPVLLARDRFDRPDGPLGATETGQIWTPRLGSWAVRGNVAAAGPFFGDPGVLETFDVGVTEHYVQASIRQVKSSPARNIGLCIRFTDTDNYTLVYVNTDPTVGVVILDRDAGVNTGLGADYPVQPWEGMTIGAGYRDGVVTSYVGGVAVGTGVPSSPDGTGVGVFANYGEHSGRSPEVDDLHVWDHVAGEVEGILWTGDVSEVNPRVRAGPHKLAEASGEGVLARAGRVDIAAPRLPVAGAPTGLVVGDILARANLLGPPQPLAEGTVTTGPVGIRDGNALDLVRDLEETERGFLHETNEGHAGFDDAAARGTVPAAAWFSDAPGAQFTFEELEPQDAKSRVINRVTGGVAAESPAGITVTDRNGSGHVDVLLPTTADGDLVVVFIASSIDASVNNWNVPLWWVEHRPLRDAKGMRVYSHACDGTESATTVRFFTNGGASPGLWVAKIVRIEDWFESTRGETMGDVVQGADPGPLVHGWGRVPTLFIVAQTGIGSGSGGSFDPDNNPPDGYGSATGLITSSGTFQYDAGVSTTTKIDCTETEDPTAFRSLFGFTTLETVVFAVRGFNGPHSKATLQNPETVGGDGRFVTVDDVASQDDHNMVRSHPRPSNLFASEAAAEGYGEAILAGHADDRPIFTLVFTANKTAAYRAQAFRRRTGDKIHLTAVHQSGMGVDGDFFIENVGHEFSQGTRLWRVIWELSPA